MSRTQGGDGSGGRGRRQGVLLAGVPVAGAGILLRLALAVLLVLAAGMPISLQWSRTAAARGFVVQEPVVRGAVDIAREALDPLLGEPIGRVDTITCGENGGGALQTCRLISEVVYDLAGTEQDAVRAAIEGAPAGAGHWEGSDGLTEIGPLIAGITGTGEGDDGRAEGPRGTITVQGTGEQGPFLDDVLECFAPSSVSRVDAAPDRLADGEQRVTLQISAELSETPMLPDLRPGPCLLGHDRASTPRVSGFS